MMTLEANAFEKDAVLSPSTVVDDFSQHNTEPQPSAQYRQPSRK